MHPLLAAAAKASPFEYLCACFWDRRFSSSAAASPRQSFPSLTCLTHLPAGRAALVRLCPGLRHVRRLARVCALQLARGGGPLRQPALQGAQVSDMLPGCLGGLLTHAWGGCSSGGPGEPGWAEVGRRCGHEPWCPPSMVKKIGSCEGRLCLGIWQARAIELKAGHNCLK